VNRVKSHSLGAALLIFLMVGQALLSMRVKSLTNDEVPYIPAGYSYIKTWDFRLNPEHPPLAKILAALPLLWLKPPPVIPLDSPEWRQWNEWRFGQMFFEMNRNRIDEITFLARIPIVLIAAVLGWMVYRWASDLYGARAGLFSLFILAFEPNILAHARLVTTDMVITLFLFLSMYRLWVYARNPGAVNFFLAAAAFSLAQASKFSALILVVIFGALLCGIYMARFKEAGKDTGIRGWSAAMPRAFLSAAAAMCVILALTGAVMFVAYGCRIEDPASRAAFSADTEQYIARTQNPLKKTGYEALKLLHVPYGYYLDGLRRLMLHFRLGQDTYALGRVTKRGVWYYFPLAMLIKVPIPLLFLSGLGILFLIGRWRSGELWFLLFPVALIFGLSMRSSIQIGIRHVLTVFPFLAVMAGAASDRWLFEKGRARRVLLLLLAIWMVASTLRIFPDYLAYFNEFVGGPKNGYLYLVDSNLDWGQDLKLLKAYMERKNLPRINLFYFGTIEPGLYGIDYETPTWRSHESPPSGVYAISTTWLYTEKFGDRRYDYFRAQQPHDSVGYSIFIYRVP